jgi:hypothetical protein
MPLTEIPPLHLNRKWPRLLGARVGSPPPGTHPRSRRTARVQPPRPVRQDDATHPRQEPRRSAASPPRCCFSGRAVTSAVRSGISPLPEALEGRKHKS